MSWELAMDSSSGVGRSSRVLSSQVTQGGDYSENPEMQGLGWDSQNEGPGVKWTDLIEIGRSHGGAWWWTTRRSEDKVVFSWHSLGGHVPLKLWDPKQASNS